MKRILPAVASTLLSVSTPVSGEVVLINSFEVPAGQRDAVIAAWQDARDFLSGQPGYIDTRLHAALTPEARFELVNIARWDTPAAFEAAVAAMRTAGVFKPPAGTVPNPSLYTIIRTD